MDSEGSKKNDCMISGQMDWNKRQIIALIRAIKKQESLWNSSSKYFKHKKKKALAWQIVGKEVGIHIDTCKKKLESLLASFRRERNKIKQSEKTDFPEIRYEPKWKYWSEMNFLRGLPDANPINVSSNSEDENSPLQQWSASARRPPRNRPKKSKFIAPIISNIKSLSDPLEPSEAKTSKTHNKIGEDEHDAFGVTVAAKLRKMDETQRLYAENIINQALYKGLTFQLTVQSDVELLQPRLIQSETYSHYHHQQQQSQQQQHHHHHHQSQQQQQQPSTIYFPTPAPASPAPSTYIQKDSTQHHVVVALDETSEDFKRNDIL